MRRQCGAALPMIMTVIAAAGAFLLFLSHAVYQERRSVRQTEYTEAAYYAAEAGIESAMADFSAERAHKGWSGDGVSAKVQVTRSGSQAFIRSVAVAGPQTVILEVQVERKNDRIVVLAWRRGSGS